MRIATVCFLLALLTLVAPSHACLWDEDTLIDEQRGLPEVSAILMGKWERHSQFFYERRVAAMTALLENEPTNAAALDNLAVAYEKLGQVDKAIEIMQRKETLLPGQYTTAANLGTFYLHAGDLDRGIEQIKRAIEINPDAHFGREKYQLMVAEYLRDAQADPKLLDRGSFVLPLLLDEKALKGLDEGIRNGVNIGLPVSVRLGRLKDASAIDPAITGIVGMIRFGTGTSPHLHAALGDLLAAKGDTHLAYRAYRRAFDYVHPRPEQMKANMLAMHGRTEHDGGYDDALIDRERAAGEAWVMAFQAHEDALLRAGQDPTTDANLAIFYDEHGSPRDRPTVVAARLARVMRPGLGHITAIAIGSVLALFVVSRLMQQRRRRATPTPQ
ncbi:MAG TPA: tetratricopeptide repeat protein [Tepidisphaeraceae bacterium]|nr:tetratricopeptide repeat protein [Tepidisphaeraceae bacterium]